MFIFYNPSPIGARVGDCAVRALTKALDVDWDKAYLLLCAKGFKLCDMPNAKNVCKIIEYCEEGGYSEDYWPMDGRMRSFQSYGRGRNASRDSRGRYSSTGNYYRSTDDIRDRIQDMMYDAPNEETKRELQRVMTRLDTM